MLKFNKIAVTGGLAAGKTTVCQLFKNLGAYVVSADEIVHQLLSPGTAIGQQVIQLLGPEIVKDDKIDRKKIAEKVFTQPNLLRALEKILHPAVFDEIENLYQQVKKDQKHSLFLAEIPLLYETGSQGQFDIVISVVASPILCKQRFHRGEEEFEQRMQQQLDPQKKAAQADYTIENNGSLENLRNQVNQLSLKLSK